MKSKLNVGLALSKDYQKVTCELIEEIIEYDSPEELKAKVRQKFKLMEDEINLQFSKLGVKNGER